MVLVSLSILSLLPHQTIPKAFPLSFPLWLVSMLLLEHIKPVPATGSLHLMGLPPGLLGFNPSFHLVLSQLQPH